MNSTNVVVVEPEPTTGTDIRDKLERLGHSVSLIPTMSPSEVGSLRDLAPDLVLIDVKLNGRADGLLIAEAIQRQHDIPVIYLAEEMDEPLLRQARITEVFRYVMKPVSERDLRGVIEMALLKHELEGEVGQLNMQLQQRLNELNALNQAFQAYINQNFAAISVYQEAADELRSLMSAADHVVEKALAHPLPRVPRLPAASP